MSAPANHRRRKASAKRIGLVTFAILALALPAAGQDRTKPAPTQRSYPPDSATIACSYGILLFSQVFTAYCGWTRRPADDAIDDAIAAIEDYVVANSSPPPTRPTLEDLKQRAAEHFRGGLTRQQCEGRDAEFYGGIRNTDADQIRKWAKQLLSPTHELIRGACL